MDTQQPQIHQSKAADNSPSFRWRLFGLESTKALILSLLLSII